MAAKSEELMGRLLKTYGKLVIGVLRQAHYLGNEGDLSFLPALCQGKRARTAQALMRIKN